MSRWAPVAAGGVGFAVLAIALLRSPERRMEHAPPGEEVGGARDAQPLALAPAGEDAVATPDAESAPAALPAEAQFDRGGREARQSTAPVRTTIHGQVVDARSGVPVPEWLGLAVSLSTDGGKRTFLGALFGRRAVKLGPDGSFEVESARPERLAATVVEWSSRVELQKDVVHLYTDERAPEGTWRLPLDVGWLARLELSGAGLRLESAGLVEIVAGAEREWHGADLLGRDGLVLYRKAALEEDATNARRVDLVAVDDKDRRFEASLTVPAMNGIQLAPIAVDLRAVAVAHGRVLDEKGEPWSGALVELVPRFDQAREVSFARTPWAECDAEGAFRFVDLDPGEHRLRAVAQFVRDSTTIWIHAGENDLGVLRMPRGGRVRGMVLVVREDAGAAWFEEPPLVILRDPKSGLELIRGVSRDLSFEFDGVSAAVGRVPRPAALGRPSARGRT